MTTLVAKEPRTRTTGHEAEGAQQRLAERFLKLCDEWCRQLMALGQESPVLSVQAFDGNSGRLQLILRNGSRWIVQRATAKEE